RQVVVQEVAVAEAAQDRLEEATGLLFVERSPAWQRDLELPYPELARAFDPRDDRREGQTDDPYHRLDPAAADGVDVNPGDLQKLFVRDGVALAGGAKDVNVAETGGD